MARRHQVSFINARAGAWQHSVEVDEGALISDVIKAEGFKFLFPCNGLGTCGKCRVKVTSNSHVKACYAKACYDEACTINLPTPSEKLHLALSDLEAGVRLACQTKVMGPITVEFPELLDSGNILIESKVNLDLLDPIWKRVIIEAPDLLNWENILTSLHAQGLNVSDIRPDLGVLQALPQISGDHEIIAVEILGNRVIAVTSCTDLPRRYAVAVDIGTTTLAAYLADFESGNIISTASALNPQGSYGADIVSRIEFAGQSGGLAKLHTIIIEAVNGLIDELVSAAAISHDDILQINLSGNTCMTHLLLNINPVSLGKAPFEPVVKNSLTLSPVELGIKINKCGLVFILPGIGGFVGADIAAGLLACKIDREKTELFLDIGTNAEIVITGKGKILACSTAAGPAFEGARISCGMPAKPGAITDLRLTKGVPVTTTIGDSKPVGICGTGLIRIIVELLKKGIITQTGKFNDTLDDANFDIALKRYYLVRSEKNPIFISQQDIREFQLAKAAIRAGLEIMMDRLGISTSDVERLFLAGAFGTYLKPEDAIFLGLLPEIPVGRISPVGNTAGAGTVISLLGKDAVKRLDILVDKIEHVELGSDPSFTEIFTEEMFFKY
jgi:uncharacterized 2Fe-2S/4Fe-4S cluster protein (DUF4445 family)